MQLFGFEIKRKPEDEKLESFAPEANDEGAVVVSGGGSYGTYLDLDGSVRSEAELITKYRDLSLQPEIEKAIDNIVNDAIIYEEQQEIVSIVLNDLDVGDKVKNAITKEFKEVTELLDVNRRAYDIFKRWYVDGRLNYHIIIDDKKINEGIKELRYIDPRKIRKVREIKRKRVDKNNPTSPTIQKTVNEYYVYSERGFNSKAGPQPDNSTVSGLRIAKDSIINVPSGLTDRDGSMVLSWLHKAIKPMNQLRALEDATLIYRISRAPERRIFYIDVGNLPKAKSEQYMRDIMTRHKNRLTYDSRTGEIRDDRKFMTMLEDYWFPRREGSRGTEVKTLEGGQNLGELSDVKYFEKKLYESLGVPIGRIDSDQSSQNYTRVAEITREEIHFSRHIDRLRVSFSKLFLDALEVQLVMKNIITVEEWDDFSKRIKFKYAHDNYMFEMKEVNVMQERLNQLQLISPFAGTYFSVAWIKKNILKQSDEEIKLIQKDLSVEDKQGLYDVEVEDDTNKNKGKK
jgi:hypothetical protein